MSKLKGHLPPIRRGDLTDPSPSRHPPLTPQNGWTRKQKRKDRLFQRLLFLGTTHFKLVSRKAKGGPAEVLRMVFNYGNIRYENQVLENIDWKSLITKTPHGNLPVLWIDHNAYGEPNAIVRHLASHLGLLGRNEAERLVVEAVLAQVEEIRDSDFIQKAFDEFSENRIDDNAELLMEVMIPKAFRVWSQHIETTPGPYVTGSGLSVADLAIYDFLSQHLDYLPLFPELQRFPRLVKLFDVVPSHPRLSLHEFNTENRLSISTDGSVWGSKSIPFSFERKVDTVPS